MSDEWKITPEGVVAVLTAVDVEAALLGEALGTLEASFGTAIGGSGSPAIADAISAWMESETPGLTKISERIQASGEGAVQATEAFIQGDLEMAANVQAQQVEFGNRAYVPPASGGGM